MTIRISVTKGYLTNVEKKAINAILNAGMASGRVGRKDYFIKKIGDGYMVSIVEKDNSLVLTKDKLKVSKSEFKIS